MGIEKVGVYVLYHDEESEDIAKIQCSEEFPTFLFHRLADSRILESSFYLNDLEKLNCDGYEWIGTLTYHALEKFPACKMHHFLRLVENGETDDFDVAGFFNPFPNEPLCKQMRSCHPGLIDSFRELLTIMGEDVGMLDSRAMTVFYSNLWVAKKDVVLAYVEWIKKVWDTIEKTPSLKESLNRDSHYYRWKDKTALLERLFQLPYMPQYPFLFERLPCYFFYSRQYRVKMI